MIIPEYRVRMHIVIHKEHFVKSTICTAQKMNLSIKDFLSKCDQILNEKRHFLYSDDFLLPLVTVI